MALDSDIKTDKLEFIKKNYLSILEWIDEEKSGSLTDIDERRWIEYVADRYHYHKQKSGIGIAEHNFLPTVKTGDIIDQSPWRPIIDYKVALDNLRSAFNVGSIFRLADATGFGSVITGGKTPGKESQQVINTSMGSTDWIPEEKLDDLPSLLLTDKKNNYRVIGVETVENSESYLEYPWPGKGIVVMGNEEYGLSQEVLKVCDDFIHLPMFGRKNSINVANAFAVIAFQIVIKLTRTGNT